MAKRELILDFSEYDLNNVVADTEEIRRYNPQRYEMEQLTAICYEDPVARHLRRLQGPRARRVLGPRPHAGHAADAGRDHVRGRRPVVQLLQPPLQADGGRHRLRRTGRRPLPRRGAAGRPLRHRLPPAEAPPLDHDLRVPVLRQPEPGLRRDSQGRFHPDRADHRRASRRRVLSPPMPIAFRARPRTSPAGSRRARRPGRCGSC